ncbi:type I-U CRISPR-associated protein Csx17 [Planctomycetota bacterium]
MSLHIHHLYGCAPAPLALYLKAIGILRLIAEQADPQARGWWQDEHFCLMTKLDQTALETFFLTHYSPTPLLSPWNGGSGFYRTWDAKNKRLRHSKNAAALDDLTGSSDTRMQLLRAACDEVLDILPEYCDHADVSKLTAKERNKLLIMPVGKGPSFPVIAKNDAGKSQVQRVLLRNSRQTPFYKSALIEVGEKVTGPWVWGSGGNDGNIDYTGRFFENLKLVLSPSDSEQNVRFLRCALFNIQTDGFLTKAAGKIGQFHPSAAGGANVATGTGSQDDTFLNPWDYVLMLEGAMIIKSRMTRRLQPASIATASTPFAMRSHAAGHMSPGSEKSDRGEQWLPLWSKPVTFLEIQTLIGEGHIQIGRKLANRPVDAVRALSRLGVARGITAFIRYGFLERNGRSTLAVSLGRIQVQHRPQVRLIDDIAPWMDRLQRLAREAHAPARLVNAERRLANAVFAVLSHDDTPRRWQAVLEAAADIELLQKGGTGLRAGPIPRLQCAWIKAIHDNSPEVRLAMAFGSAAIYNKEQKPYNQIRHHWLPLEKGARRLQIKDKRLVHDVRVVMNGRDPVADCAAVVNRRLIEAQAESRRNLPLQSAFGCGATLSDLAQLLDGQVDLSRVLTLGRALMALDWRSWDNNCLPAPPPSKTHPDEAWLALRLACLPWPLSKDLNIPAETSLVSRLMSGDAGAAVRIAASRLRASGIRVPLTSTFTDPNTARLWAAALAFPISRRTAQHAARILSPNSLGDNHD